MGFSDQDEVTSVWIGFDVLDIDLEKLVACFVIEFRRGPSISRVAVKTSFRARRLVSTTACSHHQFLPHI